MREVSADLDRWQQQGEEIALATVIGVRGSAPRLPGSRLGMTRTGKMAGSVSAGCVENDVFERVMQVLDSGRPVVASYGIADEMGLKVGLSCGGSIEVLIERFSASDVWQATRRAVESHKAAVLGIGVAPLSLLGRKLTVLAEGGIVGSIDPGVDGKVMAEANRFVSEEGARVLRIQWESEPASIFLETFLPPPRLFIIGATHIAISLCRMAKELGFQVVVVDARGIYATHERFPQADEVLREWPHEVLGRLVLDESSYVVLLTHDPKFDLPTLAQVLRSRARYVGALGSRGTHERRRAALVKEGFTELELARIRGPIGLDIGARTPEEIALSILAEMLAVRYGRDGRALQGRREAIHADD